MIGPESFALRLAGICPTEPVPAAELQSTRLQCSDVALTSFAPFLGLCQELNTVQQNTT